MSIENIDARLRLIDARVQDTRDEFFDQFGRNLGGRRFQTAALVGLMSLSVACGNGLDFRAATSTPAPAVAKPETPAKPAAVPTAPAKAEGLAPAGANKEYTKEDLDRAREAGRAAGAASAPAKPAAAPAAPAVPAPAAKPEYQDVPNAPTAAPAVPAKPAAGREQQPPTQGSGFSPPRVSVPRSLDDPDMKSYPLDASYPKNVWGHPLHQPELFVAPGWNGAWSWGVSLMHCSDGAFMETHGDPGRVVLQVEEGRDKATLCAGAMTSEAYKGKSVINDYKWGTRGGRRIQNTALKVGWWIRTMPGAVLKLFNPDNGQMSNKTITANDRGDAGIILENNNCRVGYVTEITDPTRGSFESPNWFGPDDDPKSDERINKISVKGLDSCP